MFISQDVNEVNMYDYQHFNPIFVAKFSKNNFATILPQTFCAFLKNLGIAKKIKNPQNVDFAGFTKLFENFALS